MSIIRLDKYVADSSSLTRKESAKAIKGGNVTVNGNNVNDISYKINTDSDKVTLFNKPLIYKENYYIMMNKPQGYLSVTEDKKDKTVMELLSEDLPKEKLFPAGRLDKDSEGFLFITTDGPMAHKITGPKNHVKKKYYVETDRPIRKELISFFMDGVILETGELCKSAELEITGENCCYLTITEGKYHQVKRMFMMYGLTVTYLKRVMIGNLTLDENLRLGEYRELTADEVERLCLKK